MQGLNSASWSNLRLPAYFTIPPGIVLWGGGGGGPKVPPGTYTVTWKTAGTDGHVIRGSFGFTVGM